MPNAQEIMAKLESFFTEDPKELRKKHPTVDPFELLKQIQSQGLGAGLATGGQGAQLPGQTLGGGGPQIPGAMPQGGQGFVLPQDDPFQPRNLDTMNLADYAGASQPGFNVGTAPGVGQGLGAGPNWAAMLSAASGLLKPPPEQQPFTPPGPIPGGARPGGGVKAPYVMPRPPLPQVDIQSLLQLLRSGNANLG